jgi:hypothetical protein
MKKSSILGFQTEVASSPIAFLLFICTQECELNNDPVLGPD